MKMEDALHLKRWTRSESDAGTKCRERVRTNEWAENVSSSKETPFESSSAGRSCPDWSAQVQREKGDWENYLGMSRSSRVFRSVLGRLCK